MGGWPEAGVGGQPGDTVRSGLEIIKGVFHSPISASHWATDQRPARAGSDLSTPGCSPRLGTAGPAGHTHGWLKWLLPPAARGSRGRDRARMPRGLRGWAGARQGPGGPGWAAPRTHHEAVVVHVQNQVLAHDGQADERNVGSAGREREQRTVSAPAQVGADGQVIPHPASLGPRTDPARPDPGGPDRAQRGPELRPRLRGAGSGARSARGPPGALGEAGREPGSGRPRVTHWAMATAAAAASGPDTGEEEKRGSPAPAECGPVRLPLTSGAEAAPRPIRRGSPIGSEGQDFRPHHWFSLAPVIPPEGKRARPSPGLNQ